jgi:adenylate cyclase
VSEVGKYKSEIAYHGDVLNTTARILSKCHDLNSDFIISDFIMEKVEMPRYLKTESMGSSQLKGKQQEVELHSVYLTINKDGDSRKRYKRLFRRRTQNI